MTKHEVRQLIRTDLRQVPPGTDLDGDAPGGTLQKAPGFDSIDFLTFARGLHEATGLEIPDRDSRQLSTVEGCVAYLASPG